MSTIQLSGLSTGIDTSELISQLMAIEQRTKNLYTERKETYEEKQTSLNTLETKLSDFQSSVKALSDSDELKSFVVTSSDSDIITANASHNAFEGSHTVIVNQLATSERWVNTTGMEYAEDYVGEGTFIYSYNNHETSITTTETTTLEDLVGLINNDANNPGITANLIYYNNAYHLVLNGNDAGADYRISVNSSNTQVLEADSEFTENGDDVTLSTNIIDLDQFGEQSLEGGEVIEITGTDHNGNAIAQVNLSVTRNTKLSHLIDEINDAFDGIAKATLENGKIVLTDKASGESSLSIDIAYNANGSGATLLLPSMAVKTDGGSTTASLANFTVSDFTQTQSAQNSMIKVDGFPSCSAVSEVQTLSRFKDPTSGTYTLTYEGQTTADIAYNASPAEIQAALEALTTINPGDVTVGGSENGLNDGDLTITFNNTLGDVSMISANGSNLSPGSYPITIAETAKGVPAYINRSSNTIDDVIHGVTLNLQDTTDESGETITLTRNVESLKTKLQKMVDDYNSVIEYIDEQTSYDEENKVGGILQADYTVTTIRYQLLRPLVSQTSGFIEDIDSFLMPAQLGFELDSDNLLTLDTTVLDEAIAEDYMGVLAVIGADKTGTSNSNTIKYSGSSSRYTTAGSYNVEVTVSGGEITSARMKLSSESTYRDASYAGNVIIGDNSFDSNGNAVNPENGLQLSVDLGHDGTYTAIVRIKQGFAGALENALDNILKATTGSIQIDQESVDTQIENLQDKIDNEDERLEKKEKQLIARYARLEKTLTLLQSQLYAIAGNS
ncbi:MAG: flagellar filament capping protein FliD [Sedimentisphaerales bacterium]|nr:flagellar filament capping protein FliD [Sedimentisphaerales bacterium]